MHGVNAVVEALRCSPESIVQVFTLEGQTPEPVATGLRRSGISPVRVGEPELTRLTQGARHQGVAIRLRGFPIAQFRDVLEGPGRGVLFLDGIVDPRNLGAILRSAAAAGVRGVVLPRDRSAPISAVAISASAGMAFRLRVAQVTNLARGLDDIKDAGLWSVGLATEGGRPIHSLPPIDEPAIVVGAEGDGIRRLVREKCDFLARIPMAPGVESLNASVAAGIALYELLLRS